MELIHLQILVQVNLVILYHESTRVRGFSSSVNSNISIRLIGDLCCRRLAATPEINAYRLVFFGIRVCAIATTITTFGASSGGHNSNVIRIRRVKIPPCFAETVWPTREMNPPHARTPARVPRIVKLYSIRCCLVENDVHAAKVCEIKRVHLPV